MRNGEALTSSCCIRILSVSDALYSLGVDFKTRFTLVRSLSAASNDLGRVRALLPYRLPLRSLLYSPYTVDPKSTN